MTVAIVSHDHRFLNFVSVICGVLWSGIDLFMGFVIGPILRQVGVAVRGEIIVRLVPRTFFLMPTLSIITGTTGWFLAKDWVFAMFPCQMVHVERFFPGRTYGLLFREGLHGANLRWRPGKRIIETLWVDCGKLEL
jgi:hypothetical protein